MPTLEQIRENVLSLDPPKAFANGKIDRSKCSTSVITEVDGVALTGPLCAGYLRVSTEGQGRDGFSVAEQCDRCVRFFADRGNPFILYSDAEISGSAPMYNPAMIRRMIERHAARYERNFRAVFLAGRGTKAYTAEQQRAMEAHLQNALSEIRAANEISETDHEITTRKVGRPRGSGKPQFRPGLTLLLESLNKYEVVAVSDLSRLYRSQTVGAEIAEQLRNTKTRFVGLIESLDFLSGDDFSSDIQRLVLGAVAEHQLSTITINCLRGAQQALESKRPIGKLPFYLERDAQGYARYKCGGKEAILRLCDLVESLDSSGRRLSYFAIADTLRAEFPVFAAESKAREARRLPELLANKWLIGFHSMFGLSWQMIDAIIPSERWERIQAIVQDTREASHKHKATKRHKTGDPSKDAWASTGLFRCICGGRMCRHALSSVKRKKFEMYACIDQVAKRNEGIRHTRFSLEDADAFVSGVMKHYREIASAVLSAANRSDLAVSLAQANEEVTELQAQVMRTDEAARLQAESEGIARRFTGARLSQFVDLMTYEATIDERTLLEASQDRRDALAAEMAEYVQAQEIEAVNAKIERFDELTNGEKNDLALRVFDRFETRGEDPCCVVVPVLRGGRELTPVPLITTGRPGPGRVNYSRRFPPVEAWYAECAVDLAIDGAQEERGRQKVVGYSVESDLREMPEDVEAVIVDAGEVEVWVPTSPEWRKHGDAKIRRKDRTGEPYLPPTRETVSESAGTIRPLATN